MFLETAAIKLGAICGTTDLNHGLTFRTGIAATPFMKTIVLIKLTVQGEKEYYQMQDICMPTRWMSVAASGDEARVNWCFLRVLRFHAFR